MAEPQRADDRLVPAAQRRKAAKQQEPCTRNAPSVSFRTVDSLSPLRDLLRERSVRHGDFTLASGARSSYYIDARATTMTGRGLLLVGKAGHEAIRAAGWDPDHVGGLTLGADPVAYAVAAHATRLGHALNAFTVRKRAKGHGAGRQIEGGLPAGAKVVVVDDTATSGGSLLRAAEAVVAADARVLGMLVLVDRDEGGRERVARAGYELRAVFAAAELL